jgi:hypothetical protein
LQVGLAALRYGVFRFNQPCKPWRVLDLAYPQGGFDVGIGAIAGLSIAVTEMNYQTKKLALTSPGGSRSLEYDSGVITVSDSCA